MRFTTNPDKQGLKIKQVSSLYGIPIYSLADTAPDEDAVEIVSAEPSDNEVSKTTVFTKEIK